MSSNFFCSSDISLSPSNKRSRRLPVAHSPRFPVANQGITRGSEQGPAGFARRAAAPVDKVPKVKTGGGRSAESLRVSDLSAPDHFLRSHGLVVRFVLRAEDKGHANNTRNIRNTGCKNPNRAKVPTRRWWLRHRRLFPAT